MVSALVEGAAVTWDIDRDLSTQVPRLPDDTVTWAAPHAVRRAARSALQSETPGLAGSRDNASALATATPQPRQRHTGYMTRPSGVRELHGNSTPLTNRRGALLPWAWVRAEWSLR